MRKLEDVSKELLPVILPHGKAKVYVVGELDLDGSTLGIGYIEGVYPEQALWISGKGKYVEVGRLKIRKGYSIRNFVDKEVE